MSQPKGSGAPQKDGRKHRANKTSRDVAASHVAVGDVEAMIASGTMTPEQQAHLDGCSACRNLMARFEEAATWRKKVLEIARSRGRQEIASIEVPVDEPAAEVSAYERYLANRKTLDEMKPFRLRLERATGRLTRVDRRRPKGPRGVIEGGVRLPLDPRHAADVLVAGSPPGLEIVIAQIQRDRPVRFLRGAQIGMRDGKRWQTSSTDPTGRVRLDVDIRRRRKPIQVEIAHSVGEDTLLAKLDISMV